MVDTSEQVFIFVGFGAGVCFSFAVIFVRMILGYEQWQCPRCRIVRDICRRAQGTVDKKM